MGLWRSFCGLCGTELYTRQYLGPCLTFSLTLCFKLFVAVGCFLLPSLKPVFITQDAPRGRVYASACAIEVAVNIIAFAFSMPQGSYVLLAEAALSLLVWWTAYYNESTTSVRLATVAAVTSIVTALLEAYPVVLIYLTGHHEHHGRFYVMLAIISFLRVLFACHVLRIERMLFTEAAQNKLRASLLTFVEDNEYQGVADDDRISVDSEVDPAVTRDLQRLKNIFVLPKYWSDSITFSYTAPLFRIARLKPLEQADMPLLRQIDRAKPNSEKVYSTWEGRQSLTWTLRDVYGKKYLATGMFLAVSATLNFCGPLALQQLVIAAENGASVNKVAYLIAVLFASRVGSAVCTTQYSWHIGKLTVNMMGGIKGCLFRKLQKLSAASRQQYTAGNITNMFSVDVERVVTAATGLHYVWVLPLELIVSMALLFSVVSYAMFAGLGAIVVVLMLNKYIAGVSRTASEHVMTKKDDRMKATSEVFGSMLAVKLNAWEDRFHEVITRIRQEELVHVWEVLLLGAINVFLLWLAPLLVSVVTFAVYAGAMGRTLTAARIFTAIALFRLLQEPLRALPTYITQFIQAKVSLDRLQKFLWLDDRDESHIDRTATRDTPTGSITIQRCKVKWMEDMYGLDPDNLYDIERVSRSFSEHEKISSSFSEIMKSLHPQGAAAAYTLNIPELRLQPGQLCVVQGTVGSGKSSLLACILGDMNLLRGTVSVVGNVAYTSQQAWIQNMTIRENVLFGMPFEPEKYMVVIKACGLETDLQQLPYGDLTEIGEKGLNLSGGQKARVALARMCYADADICLLDDPLAALDEIVGKQVFEDCIVGLLQHKTRVLVTNKDDIAEHPAVALRILIHQSATVVDYRSQRGAPPQYSPDQRHSAVFRRPSIMDSEFAQKLVHSSGQEAGHYLEPFSGVTRDMSISFNSFNSSAASSDVQIIPQRFVDDEERATGTVNMRVYTKYLEAGGGWKVFVLLVIVQTCWQLLQVGSDLFLSEWSKQSKHTQEEKLESNLGIYSSLALGSGLLVLVRTLTISVSGLHAARTMFSNMLESLIHAPMSWLDRNPTGRLLNRMSEDQSKVDANLPFAMGSVFATAFSLFACVIVTCVITKYLVLVVLPAGYIYLVVTGYYLTASREVQRLQQISLSPVLNYVSESISGLYVVRAFGVAALNRFCKRNEALLDENNSCNLVSYACQAWFILRIQCIGAFLLLINSILLFSLPLSAGLVGLSLSYGLSLTDGLQSLAQIWAWFENAMVSPERIQQYVDIEPEGTQRRKQQYKGEPEQEQLLLASEQSEEIPPPLWPEKGELVFDNVYFKYQPEGELVLKGLSFAVSSGEKIGIVGRTGAGKSSITMALFRIAELHSGRILVDGVDTSNLPLKILRSSIEIVPQNPVLFKGPVRGFLDPFGEYTDNDIWRALEKAHLRPLINGLGGLQIELAENGENLSVGQRQMLVLSRALLRNAKILVMDEATASIDRNTDRLLQGVLRTEFRDSTVITIAHRLDTIMDCSRIMVLSEGSVLEFDKPASLLANAESAFAQLAKEHKVKHRLIHSRSESGTSSKKENQS